MNAGLRGGKCVSNTPEAARPRERMQMPNEFIVSERVRVSERLRDREKFKMKKTNQFTFCRIS